MSRTTLPTQPDEAQAQTSSTSSSLMPMIALIVRLITLASLIVSTSLLASNSTTVRSYYNVEVIVHFNDIYAYRYALATAVIGLAYTLLRLPFSIHQVRSGKSLVNHASLIVFEFLGDKVVLSLLATGVGAAFGATLDLKTNMDELEDALEEYLAITRFSLLRSKLDDFFNRAYIPAIFLLIAFLTCGVSSILSSLALMKNTQ
ncbi:hypothetical protein Pfo_009881 [Paulownia fortunei]|nr:hypothetical protein Pfo_009881 [Paulownia fortunei]